MSDRRKQAELALRTYLDRGSKALSSLARGEVDHATDWLAKREAAFRNFLALEHAAKKVESVDQKNETWKEMLEAASQQNIRIRSQLSEAIATHSTKSRTLSLSSRALGKFMSGSGKTGFKSSG